MLTLESVILLLLLSGLAMWFLGLYARRFAPRVPAAKPYVLLVFSAGAWAFLYALDLLSTALPQKILFHNLRFLFIPFLPVLELWMVLAYLGKDEWIRRDWILISLVIPVTAVVLALTSPHHALFRYNFTLDTGGPVPVLEYTAGPFFPPYMFYSYFLLTLAVLILFAESKRRRTIGEKQTILLLFALVFPTIIGFLSDTGINPIPGVNLTPALFWIPAILYAVAIIRFHFLDIVPIARSRVIETMTAPLFVLDPDGRIIDLNPAACRLLPVPRESALGRNFTEVAPVLSALLPLSSSGGEKDKEFRWTGDGEERYFSAFSETIHTPRGRPEGRIVLLQDITGIRRAQQALRESEEKFSKAFQSSPYAIIISRPADGLILDVNEGFERISGYRAGEAVGKTAIDLHLWADENDRKTILENLESGSRIAGKEFNFRRKDGREITGLFYADLIYVQGRPYILSLIDDITEKKRSEELREALIRDLESKNEELDRFTHTISHDLKNPLFAIQGFAGILHDELSRGELVNARDHLARITEATERMDKLITSLLALSRSGRSIDNPVPLSLADVAHEAAGILDSRIRERGIELVIPDTLPTVRGDRLRLLQVMMNLIENAIKYMGTQQSPRIEVGVCGEGTATVFFVRDNGIGIAREDVQKIFGLYRRLETGVQGSGVGLATVKRIIEAHGGRVWAESEGQGKGTTIFFTLPMTDELIP